MSSDCRGLVIGFAFFYEHYFNKRIYLKYVTAQFNET